MVRSTIAAGTIIQIARGRASFATSSASEDVPTAFSAARGATAAGDRSKTTQSCPARSSRRTMFEPMRPRPIIPICITSSSCRGSGG